VLSRQVQHHEVPHARLPERDRHADPAESGADDGHPVRHGALLALSVARRHPGRITREPGTRSLTQQRADTRPAELTVAIIPAMRPIPGDDASCQ
jgi:hypothetical protein